MTFYPTLVIGSGENAAQVLAQAARLLRSFRSPLEHVVCIGLYEAGNQQNLHVPHVAISDQFVNPFAEWMCRVRAEKNLDKVRKAGITVGPVGGYLLVQILLVIDSDHVDSIPPIVHMLEEATLSLEEKIPPRLHILIIHPHSNGSTFSAFKSVDSSVGSTSLTLCSRWITSPLRSDGSVLTKNDFLTAMPYLLFAALQPINRGDGHWFFRKPPPGDDHWLVPGFGLVVLPLPEIEEALTHQLLADAYSELNSETKAPQEVVPELEPEEATWWQQLLRAVPAVAEAGAGLTLSLKRDNPELSRDPRRWLQETDEWDTRWRKETLPQNEQALQSAANEMLEAFRSYLRQYIQNNMLVSRGVLPLLRFVLDKAAKAMDRWTVLRMELTEPGGETIQSARTRFEQALEQLPERGKLITIAALITLVSWALLQGVLWLIAPRLGTYLWWVVMAAAILPPAVSGGWAYAFYRRRRAYLQECWDDYIGRLHAQHAEILRWRALCVLQNATREMKEVITSELQRAQNLQQDVTTRISLWKQLAQGLRLLLPLPLRVIVANWRHIQPMAEELWGKRDLAKVVRKGLEELGVSTLGDLQERMDDLSSYLRHQLLDHWMTPEHRQPSYYLRLRFGSEEALRQWVRERMKEASEEASALLWRCEKPAYQGWKLIEEDLPVVDDATPCVPHGDEVLIVSNVFGRVCAGKADIP